MVFDYISVGSVGGLALADIELASRPIFLQLPEYFKPACRTHITTTPISIEEVLEA